MQAYSPLIELPDPFHIVWSVPAEEFHLVKEGVGKAMLKRLFHDSKTRTASQLLADWSATFEQTQVFSETPRCARKIVITAMKGSELGILIMSGFPCLIDLMNAYSNDHWLVTVQIYLHCSIRFYNNFLILFSSSMDLLSFLLLPYREDAQICLAIFCFLILAYNHEDQRFNDIERDLLNNELDYETLHDRFYEAFMFGFCTR